MLCGDIDEANEIADRIAVNVFRTTCALRHRWRCWRSGIVNCRPLTTGLLLYVAVSGFTVLMRWLYFCGVCELALLENTIESAEYTILLMEEIDPDHPNTTTYRRRFDFTKSPADKAILGIKSLKNLSQWFGSAD